MLLKIFPSFFDRPAKIHFFQQDEGEVVELFLRRHPITNLPWIAMALFLSILPVVFIQLDQSYSLNLTSNTPTNLLVGGLALWYMFILAYIFENFLFWYFNVYIATNLHLLTVGFNSLLNRETSTIELGSIENISPRIKGIFGPLFNYGDVIIETAAKDDDNEFYAVPKPDFVTDRIQDLQAATPLRE
jgi:hypothetical protein